jgi:hypothetical protein
VEVARHIAGGRGAEEHALSLQTLVRGADRRCGAEEHGACEAPRQRPLPEQRLTRVNLYRLCVRAIHVGVDDGLPRVLQILRQFGVHGRGTDGNRRGHDERRLILPDPQGVDDGVHQPQDSAGALEAFET